jgi:hypothetical protein
VKVNGARAVVSTLAGASQGFADASGTNALFRNPAGVSVDASGNVFVAEFSNNRIRKVTAAGGTWIGPVTLRACCAGVDVESSRRTGGELMK